MWQSGAGGKSADYVKVRALGDWLQGLKQNKNKKLILQGYCCGFDSIDI